MFFLSSSSTSYLWYLFSRIRAMIESNRGRFMYLFFCFGAVVLVVVVVFHVAREKKDDEEIETFFDSSFFFPTLLVSTRHFIARYCCENTE
jgi:tellurite resistance protein TehA-like permease